MGWHMAQCSGRHVSRSLRASRRANWGTRMRLWRSLSDSCSCRGAEQTWTQEQLDSSFSLVSAYGDKQPTITKSGPLLAECLAQSESRMRQHMSECVNAYQDVRKHVSGPSDKIKNMLEISIRAGHAKTLEVELVASRQTV